MAFKGFTLPDGAWIPPELIYLLPNINPGQLKVLIAIIYSNTQIGGGEALSLTDIERITGLSRQSVVSALKELLQVNMLERQAVGNSYTYIPKTKTGPGSLNFRLPETQAVKYLDHFGESLIKRESERESLNLINSLSDSLNSPENGQNRNGDGNRNGDSNRLTDIQELREAGVYLKTAQDLILKQDSAAVKRHLEYYRYALSKNIAQGPGWLVQSLKENWPAPLGWEARPKDHTNHDGYTDWNENG
jgi:hypothetical protein